MRKIFLVCAVCASIAAMATEGALSGKFTINADGDQVFFSKGNLQYWASTDTWKLADNQWEMIAAGNDNAVTDTSLPIDLFGWGTGNNPRNFSDEDSEYATFNDWGANAISNGGNEANLWRTMTLDEWEYIRRVRPNATSLRAFGTVNNIHGYIFLPDNWTTPEGLTFTSQTGDDGDWDTNTYSGEDWTTMESNGAVFLPAAAGRMGTEVLTGYINIMGSYWASSSRSGDRGLPFRC